MKKIFLILFSVYFISYNLSAQKKKIKFGKVSQEELTMKFYEADSSANAVVLYDKGNTYFKYDNTKKSFMYIFERHVRLKIFKKDGFDEGTFIIHLYKSKQRKERILTIKGKTFNFENEKIIKTKLENSNIFYEETNKNRETAKISFPAIKEGSVIDFKYSIQSEFLFNMQTWQFQYKIPVAYSEYTVTIPEFFNYHKNQTGYDNIFLVETTNSKNESFIINWKSLPKQGGIVEKGSYELPSKSIIRNWRASKIPAFKEEPYITTYRDYVSTIEFELRTIQYPNQTIQTYTNSWEDITKKLLESEYFGKQFKVTKKIKEQSDLICLGKTTKAEKLSAIYNYVQNNYKWNSLNRLFTSEKLSKILQKKSGNSSDINLLMMSMLRAQSIQANPIILSTRSNGKIYPTHPTISAFNYVITEAVVDSKKYYLDATSDINPLGLLPKRCLNGYGRKITSSNSQEIKIKPAGKQSKTIMYLINFSEEGEINADINIIYKKYSAVNIRNKIINKGDSEGYIKWRIEENENISEYKLTDVDDIYKPVKESYKLTSSDNITFAGNKIYLSPLLNEKMTENPFKLEERKYPVDYAYPIYKKIIMQYTIPDGYEIEELPKNSNYALEDKAALYQYQVSVAGNKLQVISIFKINQTLYMLDSYKALKNFYNLVIEKQNKKIVLKKKI